MGTLTSISFSRARYNRELSYFYFYIVHSMFVLFFVNSQYAKVPLKLFFSFWYLSSPTLEKTLLLIKCKLLIWFRSCTCLIPGKPLPLKCSPVTVICKSPFNNNCRTSSFVPYLTLVAIFSKVPNHLFVGGLLFKLSNIPIP